MIDVRQVGRHLGRGRHENGWVEKTGKKVKRWRGYYHVYATLPVVLTAAHESWASRRPATKIV
jgi:hypothetical protein